MPKNTTTGAPDKSLATSAWEAYEKTLAPVRITQAVMESAVDAVRKLPDDLRAAMHRTFEEAREAYNQALDAEKKAYETYNTAATQPTLFDATPDPAKGEAGRVVGTIVTKPARGSRGKKDKAKTDSGPKSPASTPEQPS